jgi:hypothetical protein
MSFVPPRSATPSPRSARNALPVLSVGRRVFVHSRTESRRVSLTDEAGNAASLSLADGVEVEIVAWRPRGSAGTRYRVVATANGAEGWVGADELRPTETAVTPPPPSAVATAVDTKARFGQRTSR